MVSRCLRVRNMPGRAPTLIQKRPLLTLGTVDNTPGTVLRRSFPRVVRLWKTYVVLVCFTIDLTVTKTLTKHSQ